jgi:hypothetical protein
MQDFLSSDDDSHSSKRTVQYTNLAVNNLRDVLSKDMDDNDKDTLVDLIGSAETDDVEVVIDEGQWFTCLHWTNRLASLFLFVQT